MKAKGERCEGQKPFGHYLAEDAITERMKDLRGHESLVLEPMIERRDGPRFALETAGELRGGGLKQGATGDWTNRKTVSRKNLRSRGLKIGGWVYNVSNLVAKIEIPV
jgi:hypothetical protein